MPDPPVIDPAVILVVDDDPAQLAMARGSVERRFGADYRVIGVASAAEANQLLAELCADHVDVALILADQWLADLPGIELLAASRDLHPGAKRALLTSWYDRRAAEPIMTGVALGQIETFVVRPWQQADERFLLAIAEMLTDWALLHRPQFEPIRIIGPQWDDYTALMRDSLQRSGLPFGFVDSDTPEGKAALEHAGTAGPLPVVEFFDGRVLTHPSGIELAESIGVNTPLEGDRFDVIIIGAGPSGLAAAVYGASEGLSVLVVEPAALGGQAGSSSMIRNYVGFAHGISGSELMARAAQQAWLFRASFLFGRAATGVREEGDLRIVCFDDGSELCGRAVILATGVDYRRIGVPSLEALVGRGVFYGAAVSEAPSMAGGHVFVVGGANSAGQSAIFVARYATQVTMVVRGPNLTDSMSDYLIRQIEATPNITVRYGTTVIDGRGDYRLRGLTLRDSATGATQEVEAEGLFIMIGAAPRTDWLPSEVRRDEQGSILTGNDADTFTGDGGRRHAALETSVPGVFAVGDVRSGSLKRVSSAVGEGSMAIRLIHEYLATHGGAAIPPTATATTAAATASALRSRGHA